MSSSSSSSADVPVSMTGSRRQPPLQAPKPLFFIDRNAEANEDNVRRDPFRTPTSAHSPEFVTPEESLPSTPRGDGEEATNPFSPPASVISFSAEHSVPGTGSVHRVHVRDSSGSVRSEAAISRVQSSKQSFPSALRHESSDIHELSRSSVPRVDSMVRSSFMSPPMLSRRTTAFDSRSLVSRPTAKRARSTMLTGEIEKPWTKEKNVYVRLSYYITWAVAMIGVVGGALRCYFGWKQVPRVGNLCLIMQDDFDTFDTTNTWTREVDMGGFGSVCFLFTMIFIVC